MNNDPIDLCVPEVILLPMIKDEKFWAKTKRSGDCLVWIGCRNKRGYGIVTREKRIWLAHRYAFYLMTGEIPEGACICHKCDRTSCVKQSHLWKGTASENMRVMLNKKWEGKHLKNSLKCPKCASYQILSRKKDRMHWCRRCGHEWPMPVAKAA